MRYSKLLPFLLVLSVSVLLVSAFASAAQVVFQDGFESQPAEKVSHAAINDFEVDDYEPVSPAPVGTWNLNGMERPGMVEVTDWATPGAYEGNNCLREAYYGSIRCDAVQAATGAPGDSMHFEMYVNIDVLESWGTLMLWAMDAARGGCPWRS